MVTFKLNKSVKGKQIEYTVTDESGNIISKRTSKKTVRSLHGKWGFLLWAAGFNRRRRAWKAVESCKFGT